MWFYMAIDLSYRDICSKLYTLSTVKKDKAWIREDLTTDPSSGLGRILWSCIAKYFSFLRSLLFKVDLEKSKELLGRIKTTILKRPFDQDLKDLYNAAVDKFNSIAPKHAAVRITSNEKFDARKGVNVAKTAQAITVGTYNILFPQMSMPPNQYSTDMGYDVNDQNVPVENSATRLPRIVKNIRDSNLDVICLQEVVSETFDKLVAELGKDYTIVWAPHEKFHGVGIMYKNKVFNERFKKLEHVDVPLVNTATGEIFNKKRAHIMIDLELKGSVYRIVSCHLQDPREFKTNKDLHVKEVVQRTLNTPPPEGSNYTIARYIIAGDMNQDQHADIGETNVPFESEKWASCFQPFLDNDFNVDGNYSSSEWTKEFKQNALPVSKNRRIDWIWLKDLRPVPINLSGQDQLASDHSLVASTIS